MVHTIKSMKRHWNISVVAHIMFSAIVACNKISVCITNNYAYTNTISATEWNIKY